MTYAEYYEDYLAQQAKGTKKPTKKTVNGKVVYYDNQGKKTTKATYDKQLKAYTKENTYTTKTENGQTKYYKGGNEITKEEYQKGASSKISYSSKTVNGKTKYYRTVDGKKTEVSKTAYNNGKAGKPYKESGKYYDKNGKEISKSSYDSAIKSAANKKAVEKSYVTWSKKADFQDDYMGTLEDLAKKVANNKKLTLQDEKNIKNNQDYINMRDSLAKSLTDGSYYNQETDPYAKQLRDDYIRNARIAADDTLANLAKRTGGLASSYAGAVANNKYNDYMDELASKLLNLRSTAETRARENMGMYDTMNKEYRDYQKDNNNVINANNVSRSAEWESYMNQLKSALGAYNNLSDTAYNRWLQAQQMYEGSRQFDEDLAYKYAALESKESPVGGLGGVKTVGGIGAGVGGGGNGKSVEYTATKQAPNVGQTRPTTAAEEASARAISEALAKANAPRYDDRGFKLN